MATYNPAMQKVHLADVASDAHGLISKRTAELDGLSVTQVTFNRGARWSNDLKDYAGTELCELPHVALVSAAPWACGCRTVRRTASPRGT